MGILFIKDNKVIASGKISSLVSGVVVVYYNPETMNAFSTDSYVQSMGKDCKFVRFEFSKFTGEYIGTYDDEPDDRMQGVSIVDAFKFEYAYYRTKRYESVIGYGAASLSYNTRKN